MDQKAIIDFHTYYEIPFIGNQLSYIAVKVCIIDLIRTFVSYPRCLKNVSLLEKLKVAKVIMTLLKMVLFDNTTFF